MIETNNCITCNKLLPATEDFCTNDECLDAYLKELGQIVDDSRKEL